MHESKEGCLLHRDIKPDNLFLSSDDEDAQVVIGDFGCTVRVARMGDKFESSEWAGTKAYNAPETFRERSGHGEWTDRSDVWSLGASIHSGLSLNFPFAPLSGESRYGEDAQLKRILAGNFRPLPVTASVEVKEFVQEMLQVDATKRPSAGEALEHEWIRLRQEDRHLNFVLADLARFSRQLRFRAAVRDVVGEEGDESELPKDEDAPPAGINSDALDAFVEASSSSSEKEDTRGVIGADVLRRIRRVFADKADVTTGELGEDDFAEAMRELNLHGLPIRRIFETMDTDESGAVSADELIRGLVLLVRPGPERARAIFDLYDRDGDGKVGVDEVALMLRLTATSDSALERVKCDRMAELFGRLDTSGEGTVSWEDFCKALDRDEQLADAFMQPNRFFRDYVTRSRIARAGGTPMESTGWTKRVGTRADAMAGKTVRNANALDERKKDSRAKTEATTRSWILATIAALVLIALIVRMFEKQSARKPQQEL